MEILETSYTFIVELFLFLNFIKGESFVRGEGEGASRSILSACCSVKELAVVREVAFKMR